jgi:hypothetical protein
MLVYKKEIAEAVQSQIVEAQIITNDTQTQTVVVVKQHSPRKYGVYIQLAGHRPGIKVGDKYLYESREVEVHAVITKNMVYSR